MIIMIDNCFETTGENDNCFITWVRGSSPRYRKAVNL
jgi:hypothetical protein